MVFIIDLPRFESAEQRDAQILTPFAEELFYFLRMQTLDEKLISSLKNYNFSETSRYGFVHSMWVRWFDGKMFSESGSDTFLAGPALTRRQTPGREQVRRTRPRVVDSDGLGADRCHLGYCGLGRAVGALGLQSNDPLQLDYVVRPGGFHLPVIAAKDPDLFSVPLLEQ
jgi:hypothetical protein